MSWAIIGKVGGGRGLPVMLELRNGPFRAYIAMAEIVSVIDELNAAPPTLRTRLHQEFSLDCKDAAAAIAEIAAAD